MVTIIFETHGTTTDNEKHLASGSADVDLSKLGKKQAKELGQRRNNEAFDAIFCSGLQRSLHTAQIAFGGKLELTRSDLVSIPGRTSLSGRIPLIQDCRLNECDYGDMTQHPSSTVDPEKPQRIATPFPNGESYEQTSDRMKHFLQDLFANYNGKKIMIIGHRATQYALELWINGRPLEEVIPAVWHWQPGWTYVLK